MIKKIFPAFKELNLFAAEKIVEIAAESIEENDKFSIALAGGSTPKSLYQLLASEKFKKQIDWSKTYFFFGDERNVLPDDDESNFKMVNESFFVPLNIDEKNIFRWQTELPANQAAKNYSQEIKSFFQLDGNQFPRFDLILLGMGDDGHTASLFPFTKALTEIEKIAVVNRVEKFHTDRLTLTYPAINNAANVFFLVKSADKAEILKTVLEGKYLPDQYPSQGVRLTDGNLYWLIEKEAASFLN